MMPSISTELRIILGVVAALAGILSAAIGNVLAINIAYFFSRRGRKPNPRPIRLWVIFYFSAFVSVALATFTTFAPTLQNEPKALPITTATPTSPSNIMLVATEGKNIEVKLGDEPIISGDTVLLNETITVNFTVLNNGSSPVEIKTLVIGARGPGVSCDDKNVDKWSAQDNPFPVAENITIQPGEKYEYQGSRAFYQPGKYFLEPNIQASNGVWGGIQPFSCVNIIVNE